MNAACMQCARNMHMQVVRQLEFNVCGAHAWRQALGWIEFRVMH